MVARSRSRVEVVETNYVIRLCSKNPATARFVNQGPLTVAEAKEILGWEVAEEGHSLFKDLEGNPIFLRNNTTNRPFRMTFANRYKNEILRNKWRMNGETMIVDDQNMTQDGQHRLVAFILAEQERKKNPTEYAKYWAEEITIECLIFSGISHERDVVNTLNIGQRRTLGDVLFREGKFDPKLPPKKKQLLSNILSGATRLVWLRSHGKTVRDAPGFPHSEALDFIDLHPGLVNSVQTIWTEEGGDAADGKLISGFISMATAAGLHYLMSTSGTDPEAFQQQGSEVLNFGMQEQADLFWSVFASGKVPQTSPIGMLKHLLKGSEASSGRGRDEILGMVVKAFNAWNDNQKNVTSDDLLLEMKEIDGTWQTDEDPRLGGIDVHEITHVPNDDDANIGLSDEEVAMRAKVGTRKGRVWKKGDTAWVVNPEGGHYFATINETGKDDDDLPIAFVADEDGAEWQVSTTELSLKYPDMANA